jgi:hypothetical protein
MTVALLKPAYVPNPDTHKVWADIAVNEIVGAGYVAGGQVLANKSENYDAATDRTNLLADDSVWAGATFQTGFAAVYDNSGAKPLWSLVNFEEIKDVAGGTFTIDWAAVGLLFVTQV